MIPFSCNISKIIYIFFNVIFFLIFQITCYIFLLLPLLVLTLPTEIELSINPVNAYVQSDSSDVTRTKRNGGSSGGGSFDFIGAIRKVRTIV